MYAGGDTPGMVLATRRVAGEAFMLGLPFLQPGKMRSLKAPLSLNLRKRWLGLAVLVMWTAVGCWQVSKPMPAGTDIATPLLTATQVRFLHDVTHPGIDGQSRHEQQIFDEVMRIIDGAQHHIVADFFLFNDMMGASSAVHRPLSGELADRLIARKRAVPELNVLLITDPINDVYGGAPSALLERLRANDIQIAVTNLEALRDSNPAYSAIWRSMLQWWGNTSGGWLPNPFDAVDSDERITLRSWLALMNFKANHRKVIVADRADGQLQALLTSANPHDASSGHSNVALNFVGPAAAVALESELDVARFSGWRSDAFASMPTPDALAAEGLATDASAQLQLLTEEAIREHLLATFNDCSAGDAIDIAMFYLSDRKIIDALLAAAERGVQVRLILDPNRDAFGRQKDGVPNRPVANELITTSDGRIQVRWYQTEGEQFHTKLTVVRRGGDVIASLGSANLTRRNLGNYNLEANIGLLTPADSPLGQQLTGYFARLWGNDDAEYTTEFAAWRDTSRLRYWRYRFMEATGLSTF